MSLGRNLGRRCYVLTMLVLLTSVVFPVTETYAQTANIGFTYSGSDLTGLGATVSGSGSFTIPVGSNSSIDGSSLSAFQFTQTTFVPAAPPDAPESVSGTFNYGLGDLNNFSLNFGVADPSLSNTLSLNTNAVNGSSSDPNFVFYPESISANAGSAGTYNVYGAPLTAGTVTLNQAALTQAINTNAVHVQPNGATISATFTPNFGLSLQQAAALEGFVGFNWVQQVVSLPDPSPFYAVNYSNIFNPIHLTSSSVRFNDPYQGGYTYNPLWNSYPFYFEPSNSLIAQIGGWALSDQETNNTLYFGDAPADPCLFGGSVKKCGGPTSSDPKNQIVFNTYLVGMLPGNVLGPSLDMFAWESNFNGTSGGVATLGNLSPIDVGSGFGGVTLLSEGLLENSPGPRLGGGVSSVLICMFLFLGRRKAGQVCPHHSEYPMIMHHINYVWHCQAEWCKRMLASIC